jgi:hypothetical protein
MDDAARRAQTAAARRQSARSPKKPSPQAPISATIAARQARPAAPRPEPRPKLEREREPKEENMFQPEYPTKLPDFQIDPMRSPLFRMEQLHATDNVWHEVGHVWTVGASRTSSTEHWYLYTSVPASSTTTRATRAPYVWAGYDTNGQIASTTIRLVPVAPTPGQDPGTFKAYLEREHGVTVTYVKGEMSGG